MSDSHLLMVLSDPSFLVEFSEEEKEMMRRVGPQSEEVQTLIYKNCNINLERLTQAKLKLEDHLKIINETILSLAELVVQTKRFGTSAE